MVLAAAAACEDRKAEDIRILELDPADSGFTDFFLIASGTNERQVQAIGDAIEMQMKREFGTYANSVEGRRQAEWILIDYVDFVCHIFSAEKRAFYDIERLRKSAPADGPGPVEGSAVREDDRGARGRGEEDGCQEDSGKEDGSKESSCEEGARKESRGQESCRESSHEEEGCQEGGREVRSRGLRYPPSLVSISARYLDSNDLSG